MRSWLIRAVTLAVALAAPLAAGAHEVYVLTPQEITNSLHIAPFNMWVVLTANLHQFIFWAFIAALTVFVAFGVSLVRPLERFVDPLFERGRRYAPAVARVTIGLSFLAAAYYQASYGPELPLAATFGGWTPLVTAILIVIGVLITIGLWARLAALVALGLYIIACYFHGWYMLTYTNYLGEILVLLIIGAHHGSLDHAAGHAKNFIDRLSAKVAPYSFLILRVCFGVSLLYASLYAKVFYNNLALMVAELPLAGHAHAIAYYFGLEPHFMVLGAAIIEIVIALFFILGIEIRFTSLFLEFWLSMSLWWFGEVVWPHVILIGIPIAFILYGYDKYSLEGWLFRKKKYAPVL